MSHFSRWLFIITILGAIPRGVFLITRGSFWFDELFTLELAKLPFLEMLRLASQDTNPPLWTIIMWPWAHLLPHAEWIVRLPALALGVAAIPLVGLIGKKLANPAAGLIAAALVAVSPTLIYFSTEARMYALFVFLTLLTCFFLITHRHRAYYVSLPLLLASHLYAIIPAFAYYLWGALTHEKQNRRRWHCTHFVLITVWGLWFAWSFLPKVGAIASNSWFAHAEARRGWPFSMLSSLTMVAGTVPWYVYWLVFTAMLGFVAYALYRGIRAKQTALLLPITVLGLGFIVALLVGPPKIKYFLFLLPVIAIIIGAVTARWRAAMAAFLIVIAIVSTAQLTRTFRFSWDRAAAFAETQQDAITLIPWTVNALPFRNYYRDAVPALVIPAPGTADTSIQTLLAHNWRWELKPDYLREQLAALVPKNGELLVVQSDPYVLGVREWLEEHGWNYEETKNFDGMGSVMIERYEK